MRLQDQNWLDIVDTKLTSVERNHRRQMIALEYFYRAWQLGPSERFTILCMALDAVFGKANDSTQAVIDGVRDTLGTHLNETRLRDLIGGLRASVIHGGAPDVYGSRKYRRYYTQYENDPIFDLEVLVSHCLRAKIFGAAFKEQDNPNAAVFADLRSQGAHPAKFHRPTILDEAGLEADRSQ